MKAVRAKAVTSGGSASLVLLLALPAAAQDPAAKARAQGRPRWPVALDV